MYVQYFLGMVIHGGIVQIKPLEVMESCADYTFGHRRFESSAKVS